MESLRKDWTILVYGGGVNNLDASIRKNWQAISQKPMPENVDVFVRHFGQDGQVSQLHVDRSGVSTPSLEPPASDSSSPHSLADFLSAGIRQYPAERYLVVISSHGKGAEGAIEDDRSHRLMAPQELKQAFEAGQAANAGKPLDAVLFDACRMASLEVATELSGSVGVAIASMDNLDAAGYDLHQVVLSASTSDDARQLGHALVSNDEVQQMKSCLSLSAVDLNQLVPLQKAAKDLAGELRQLDPQSAQIVRDVAENTRRNTISPVAWELADMLSDHILGSRTVEPETLGHWLDTTRPGPAVALVALCRDLLQQESLPQLRPTLQAVLEAHDQAVFSARAHDRGPFPGGLTVTLPTTTDEAPLYSENLMFDHLTGWSQAVKWVVPPNQPARSKPSWLEEELQNRIDT